MGSDDLAVVEDLGSDLAAHVLWWIRSLRSHGRDVTDVDLDAHVGSDLRSIGVWASADAFRTNAPTDTMGRSRVVDARHVDRDVAVEVVTPAGLRVEYRFRADPVDGRIASAPVPKLAGGVSTTALMVAMMRRVHSHYDGGFVLDDPFAELLGGDLYEGAFASLGRSLDSPAGRGRWNIVARSRFAEDTVLAAHDADAVDQYVILGSGLDSFAYRHHLDDLSVFEVDVKAMLDWKRTRLADGNVVAPANVHFVPCDFETERFDRALVEHGFDAERPAVVAWLGITYYLTGHAIRDTLERVAAWAAPTSIVLDACLPENRWDDFDAIQGPQQRAAAAAARSAGEPYRSLFDPDELAELLRTHGFADVELLDHEGIRERWLGDHPTPGPRPTYFLARGTTPAVDSNR